MVTDNELNTIIKKIDLDESITLIVYENLGVSEVIQSDGKQLELKLKTPDLKLKFLPLIFLLGEDFQSTCFVPNYDELGDRYCWEGVIILFQPYMEQCETVENINKYIMNSDVLFHFLLNQSLVSSEVKDFYEKLLTVKDRATSIYVEFMMKKKM